MSVSGKAASSVLKAAKKIGLFHTGEAAEEMKKARSYDLRHPYKQPENTKQTLYATVHISDYPCLVIRRKGTADHHNVVFFIHGGGDKDTWKEEISFARNYGKQLDMDVFYPMYPPLPEASLIRAVNVIYDDYMILARAYGPDHICIIADSWGGFLALNLISLLNERGNSLKMPQIMVLNSPFAFPMNRLEWEKAELYEKKDPIMTASAMKLMMDEVYAGDKNVPDEMMYPLKMNFKRVPATYIFYGEEVCAAAADSILDAYERSENSAMMNMHIEPGMIHCYAIAPVFPEGKRDFIKQTELIKKALK